RAGDGSPLLGARRSHGVDHLRDGPRGRRLGHSPRAPAALGDGVRDPRLGRARELRGARGRGRRSRGKTERPGAREDIDVGCSPQPSKGESMKRLVATTAFAVALASFTGCVVTVHETRPQPQQVEEPPPPPPRQQQVEEPPPPPPRPRPQVEEPPPPPPRQQV